MTALISKENITALYLYLAWPNFGFDVLNITMHTEVAIHSMNAYVWCVAHLMKFHLLLWEVVKVKFLMNSNMTLTVLNLHQKDRPKGATRFLRSKSLRQGQSQIKVTP